MMYRIFDAMRRVQHESARTARELKSDLLKQMVFDMRNEMAPVVWTGFSGF
jgi:hypothetical protein